MTTEQINEEVKAVAETNDIAQYKAAMLEYIKESKKESEAKKNKEKLKAKIKATLKKIGTAAAMVAIPGSEKFAVAYGYTQAQPKYDHDLMHTLISEDIITQFHTHGYAECFTVVEMEEETASARVAESNEKMADESPTPSKQH